MTGHATRPKLVALVEFHRSFWEDPLDPRE